MTKYKLPLWVGPLGFSLVYVPSFLLESDDTSSHNKVTLTLKDTFIHKLGLSLILKSKVLGLSIHSQMIIKSF